MEQKKILLIATSALVLLLALAFPLYNRLSQGEQPDQLMTLPQSEKPTETIPTESTSAVMESGKHDETQPTQPAASDSTQPPETQPKPTQPAETQPKPTQPPETQPKPTQPPETQPTQPPVTLEYDFTVVDGNGKSVKLSDYVGKPIVLNFWASWCGPCKSEMPEFQEVYEEMGQQVQFLMVNATVSGDTVDGAKAFVQQSGYTFPVLFDTKGNALHTFGVDAFPTTYFLDKEGNPVAYAVGAISKDSLLKGINMID